MSEDSAEPERITAAAERLQSAFARCAAEWTAAAERLHAGSDGRAIEDLSLATRRLLTAFRLWDRAFSEEERSVTSRELRRLGRRLAKCRELEAQVAWLEPRVPLRGAIGRVMSAALLESIRERLARRRRRAARRAEPRRLEHLIDLMEGAARNLAPGLSRDPTSLDRALHHEHELDTLARAALRLVTRTPDRANLHRAWIMITKWRHAAEWVELAMPGTAAQRLMDLGAIQENLETVRDGVVLSDRLRRAFRAGAVPDAQSLRGLIAELESERRQGLDDLVRIVQCVPTEPTQGQGSEEAGDDARWREGEKDRMARWLMKSGRGP